MMHVAMQATMGPPLRLLLLASCCVLLVLGAGHINGRGVLKEGEDPKSLSSEDWKQRLTPKQYHVCRQKGTERAFTGALNFHSGKGVFTCVCCGAHLFSSSTKFDSGSGWPSFWQALESEDGATNVSLHEDRSLGMRRTEVTCSKCNSHLGHVFEDGPRPTGLRFCINSEALHFEPDSASDTD